VVFDDGDLDAAANGVIAGVFAATGQTCLAGSRLLVHEAVAEALVDRIVARASTIKLGDPKDPSTGMGPVSNLPQYQKVLSHLASAQEQGATVACGGEPAPDLAGLRQVDRVDSSQPVYVRGN
jgi:(Z)-2-((N-methylformamido)methylene)-5-hydroxybutyrolactone dehydrogenase